MSSGRNINTRADMTRALKGRPTSDQFRRGNTIKVDDKFQQGYTYKLTHHCGTNIENPETEFYPELSPPEMLQLGVFEGKYLNDCVYEFPRDWFVDQQGQLLSTLSPEGPDLECNRFKIKSRQSLGEWRRNGWIPVTHHRSAQKVLRDHGKTAEEVEDPDPRGWFQWWARYYLGRRVPIIDEIQQKRWRAYKRHVAQIVKNCEPGDYSCRPRQRQGVLQWAYDPDPEGSVN